MKVYEIENGRDGIFTAVYDSYLNKETPDLVTSESMYAIEFLSEVSAIKTDKVKASKVRSAVLKYSSEKVLDDIGIVLLSCSDAKETVIFNFVKSIIDNKRNVSYDFGSKTTADFNTLKERVLTETHRFKGFMRFSETTNGLLYAKFEPDNDIIKLVAAHFRARLNNEAFVLHDVKRNKVAAYDKNKVYFFTPDVPLSVYINEKELHCRSLWKEYFDAVNIDERKNVRQQKNYMPTRYWKNLTEFVSDVESGRARM